MAHGPTWAILTAIFIFFVGIELALLVAYFVVCWVLGIKLVKKQIVPEYIFAMAITAFLSVAASNIHQYLGMISLAIPLCAVLLRQSAGAYRPENAT